MHWPQGRPADWREQLARGPAPPPRPVVDAELADLAYRALLSRLTLSDAHRAALLARGMTDEQIARHGYVSSPANEEERRSLAAEVAAEVARDLAGAAPGFVRDTQGRPTLVCGDDELLIPVRDAQGRVVGIRRRLDDPGDGGKYRWFSAKDGRHSVGQDGNTVHVARPARQRTDRVVVVEGEIKANVAADRFGCIVVSVPGVSAIRGVLPALAELSSAEVVLAYDADMVTNPNVARSEMMLAHRLIDAGYRVARWTWELADAKGLDDLIALGLLPFPVPHPVLTQPLATTEPVPVPEAGRKLEELRAERDAAVFTNRARARIQRNAKLPARPMAAVIAGVFAQAATASRPAGDYDGKVPAGFVAAPVRELAIDAGCKPGNGGQQLKALQAAGLITRRSVRETLPAGQADPETGEIVGTPRVYSRHFVAITGHEHEAVTPERLHELVDRMAAYDSGEPERRGGKRIPRCPDHPDAPVHRHWVARCSVCNDDLTEERVDVVPAMLLEPPAPDDQSLMARDTESERDDLGHEDDALLGDRIKANKDRACDEPEPRAPHDQTLTDRNPNAPGRAPALQGVPEEPAWLVGLDWANDSTAEEVVW